MEEREKTEGLDLKKEEEMKRGERAYSVSFSVILKCFRANAEKERHSKYPSKCV